MSTPKNENERVIARINAVYDRLSDDPGRDSKRVLTYIREALTPEAIAQRGNPDDEDDNSDKNVDHLHAVAREHLRYYESKDMSS